MLSARLFFGILGATAGLVAGGMTVAALALLGLGTQLIVGGAAFALVTGFISTTLYGAALMTPAP
jgi:hypothetical protein